MDQEIRELQEYHDNIAMNLEAILPKEQANELRQKLTEAVEKEIDKRRSSSVKQNSSATPQSVQLAVSACYVNKDH